MTKGPIVMIPSGKTLVLLALAALACNVAENPASLSNPTPSPTPRGRPNIIVWNYDDARRDDFVHMPNITRLAAQATTFTKFYAPAVCSPSRATLLTGMYPHNHKIASNEPPKGGYAGMIYFGLESGVVAVPLQRSGYTTMIAGKYMNQYDGNVIPPGWTETYIRYQDGFQFDYWLRLVNGYEYHGFADEDFEGAVVGDKAIDFVQRAPQPFFAYVAPTSPHLPHESPRRHAGQFRDLPFVRLPSYNEADVSDKPVWVRYPSITQDQEDDIIGAWRSRLESMLSPDEKFGLMVQALQAAGRLQNTYIFLTSDNGWFLGEHRYILGKGAPYEEASHMPLLVWGPGVFAGKQMDHLLSMADIAPTVLELAGVAVPEAMDGKSFAKLLSTTPMSPDQWRRAVLFETMPWFQAIRYVDSSSDSVAINWDGASELYDMRRDPYQLDNLHAVGGLPPNLPQIEQQLQQLATCRGGTCR